MQAITEAQVVLSKDGSIELMVVKGSAYTDVDEKKLLASAKKYIAEDIDIRITYTDKIPRIRAGKFRAVVRERE